MFSKRRIHSIWKSLGIALPSVLLTAQFATAQYKEFGRATLLLAQDWRICRQIGEAYREIYAFETKSFHINICQRGQQYTFTGDFKPDAGTPLILPARRTGSNAFEAVNGSTVYTTSIVYKNNNGGRPTYELVLRQLPSYHPIRSEESISGFGSEGTTGGLTETNILVFGTNNYAVRIYSRGGQTLMNVFNKRDGTTWLNGTPVRVDPNSKGVSYTTISGAVTVKAFRANNGTRSLQIGSQSPEYGG